MEPSTLKQQELYENLKEDCDNNNIPYEGLSDEDILDMEKLSDAIESLSAKLKIAGIERSNGVENGFRVTQALFPSERKYKQAIKNKEMKYSHMKHKPYDLGDSPKHHGKLKATIKK
jgi:hypothetical protein